MSVAESRGISINHAVRPGHANIDYERALVLLQTVGRGVSNHWHLSQWPGNGRFRGRIQL